MVDKFTHLRLTSVDKLPCTNGGQIQFVHGQFGHTFVHDLVTVDKFRGGGQIEFGHGSGVDKLVDKFTVDKLILVTIW